MEVDRTVEWGHAYTDMWSEGLYLKCLRAEHLGLDINTRLLFIWTLITFYISHKNYKQLFEEEKLKYILFVVFNNMFCASNNF